MTNIIIPGAINEDPSQWVYELIGGPLHGSKVPIPPAIVIKGIEVGLPVGGHTICYRPVDKENSAGRKWREYHYVEPPREVKQARDVGRLQLPNE